MATQEQVRYHQFMRPRLSNPTYVSSYFGASLPIAYNSIPLLTKKQSVPHLKGSPQGIQKIDNTPTRQQITPKKQQTSRLSRYGSSSLKSLKPIPTINEKDIYQKQRKHYNIISLQPINTKESIKKYPKFHLEDLDNNYFKKIELEQEYHPNKSELVTVINPQK